MPVYSLKSGRAFWCLLAPLFVCRCSFTLEKVHCENVSIRSFSGRERVVLSAHVCGDKVNPQIMEWRMIFKLFLEWLRSRSPSSCPMWPTHSCDQGDKNYSHVWEIWYAPWILLSHVTVWLLSGPPCIHCKQCSLVAGLLPQGEFSLFLSLVGDILIMSLLILFSWSFVILML